MRFRAKKTIIRRLSVIVLYGLVAFFILHIFVCRWGVRGNDERFGFTKMLQYKAYKPFAYRVFTPAVINAVGALFPETFLEANKKYLTESSPLLRYHRIPKGLDARVSLAIHIAYAYLFTSLILTLMLLRALSRKLYKMPDAVVDCAPAVGLLLVPFTFIHGGYVYDFPELMLSTLLVWCILKKKLFLYYPVFIAAILNKESNALLVIVFSIILFNTIEKKRLFRHLFFQLCIAGALLLGGRYLFAGNPGAAVENHLQGNIIFWLRPQSYFLWFDPYFLGISIFPRGGNIVLLLALAWLLFYRWEEKPKEIMIAFCSLSAVVSILFIYGGFQDEIRVFLFTFALFYLLAVYSVYKASVRFIKYGPA